MQNYKTWHLLSYQKFCNIFLFFKVVREKEKDLNKISSKLRLKNIINTFFYQDI